APAPFAPAPPQAQPTPQAPAPFAPAPPQAQSFGPPAVAPQASAPPVPASSASFGPPVAAPRSAPQAPAPKAKAAPAPIMMTAPNVSVGNDMDAAPVFSKGMIGLFAVFLVV